MKTSMQCLAIANCLLVAGLVALAPAAAGEPRSAVQDDQKSNLQDGWPAVESYEDLPPIERNALQARRALIQSDRYLRGWLSKADPVSGLIPENLARGIDRWNGRNNAADNYAFMVLTAALTDRRLMRHELHDMLINEQRLTNRVDRLGDVYKFSTQAFEHEAVDMDRIIFDNSEYVKDGLMPLTEWLGDSPWSERISGIIDDIWKHAPVKTPAGNIPSIDDEVNGEMMQLTARYFWKTGDEKYLDYAQRIADWYLLGNRHPTRDAKLLRLRDHGCELISGLTEVYLACHYADNEKAKAYREPLYAVLDRVLEVGVNEHGMMFNKIDPVAGKVKTEGFSDNWGYNYNGFYTVYLVDGIDRYRDAVCHALKNLDHYRGYAWEGRGYGSHDGYADSIECAINLYNREPVPQVAGWIDSQMRIMLAMQGPDGIIRGWHGDGNFARTAIMHALMKQQGVTVQPWREDIGLGALTDSAGNLELYLAADKPWTGKLVFDQPRHKTVMHMPIDYPRINQFPEWFTVGADSQYEVMKADATQGRAEDEGRFTTTKNVSGTQLIEGLPVKLDAPAPLRLKVRVVSP